MFNLGELQGLNNVNHRIVHKDLLIVMRQNSVKKGKTLSSLIYNLFYFNFIFYLRVLGTDWIDGL